VAALGLYFVIDGIAWTMFIYNGVPVPDSFTTILATIAGGLVGVLAPAAGPARSSEPRQEERPPQPADIPGRPTTPVLSDTEEIARTTD
jgi:hypothetical protein